MINDLLKYQQVNLYDIVSAYQSVDNFDIKRMLENLFPALNEKINVIAVITNSEFCAYSKDPSTDNRIEVHLISKQFRNQIQETVSLHLINGQVLELKDIPIKLLKHLNE